MKIKPEGIVAVLISAFAITLLIPALSGPTDLSPFLNGGGISESVAKDPAQLTAYCKANNIQTTECTPGSLKDRTMNTASVNVLLSALAYFFEFFALYLITVGFFNYPGSRAKGSGFVLAYRILFKPNEITIEAKKDKIILGLIVGIPAVLIFYYAISTLLTSSFGPRALTLIQAIVASVLVTTATVTWLVYDGQTQDAESRLEGVKSLLRESLAIWLGVLIIAIALKILQKETLIGPVIAALLIGYSMVRAYRLMFGKTPATIPSTV